MPSPLFPLPGGTVVTLASSTPAAATVPATLTIPEGLRSVPGPPLLIFLMVCRGGSSRVSRLDTLLALPDLGDQLRLGLA